MSEPFVPRLTVDGISLPLRGVYDVDPVHSFVMFRVRHLVVGRVDGRIASFQGQFTVVEDPARPFDRFEVTFEPVAAEIQRSDFELTTELRQESGEPGTGPDIKIRADVEAFLRERRPEFPQPDGGRGNNQLRMAYGQQDVAPVEGLVCEVPQRYRGSAPAAPWSRPMRSPS